MDSANTAAALSGDSPAQVILEPYRDYRGVQMVGVYRWLPQYGIGLATEVSVEAVCLATNSLPPGPVFFFTHSDRYRLSKCHSALTPFILRVKLQDQWPKCIAHEAYTFTMLFDEE